MKIINLLQSNNQINEYIVKTLPAISSSLQKTKFKKTGRALLSLLTRSGYLNNEILSASAQQNTYACAVLFRPIIEHNFRHLYIFTRALNDNNDKIGEKYYRVLRGDEDRQAIYNINKYTQRIYPEKTQWSLGGERNNSIREIAKEFRIDEIFYYLVENNNNDALNLIKMFKKEYLLERLTQYTNFSSSVHGGPFGEETLSKAQKKNLETTLIKFATESFELYKSLVKTTYLFAYLMDNSNQKLYEKIKKLT